jgi:hypothetical protein
MRSDARAAQVEAVGKDLRRMMPFLNAKEI